MYIRGVTDKHLESLPHCKLHWWVFNKFYFQPINSSDKYGASKNPDSEGRDNYSASYSRPHKPYREPHDDMDTKPSNKEYSL